MKIKKGPYGFYAIERTAGNPEIYDYAGEIIESSIKEEFLTVFIDAQPDITELSYDFSGLISIEDYMAGKSSGSHHRSSLAGRRGSIRAFLLSLSGYTDMLLFPCALCRDHRYIFTDPDGTSIKFCMYPWKYEPHDLSLAAISEEDAEQLLDHPFFTEVLTGEEIQQIVYAISSGNEKMLADLSETMENTGSGVFSIKAQQDTGLLMPSRELLFGFLCSIVSSHASRISYLPVSLLFFIAAVIFLIMAITCSDDNRMDISSVFTGKRHPSDEESLLSRGRREALFDYEEQTGKNGSPAYEEPLMIRGTSASGSDGIKYGMYSDRILIGSDRFLSDLFIDRKDIASIHAEISRQNGRYYVRPLSGSHPTYLENRRLAYEQDYELKSGQRLTLGDVELELTCGFGE